MKTIRQDIKSQEMQAHNIFQRLNVRHLKYYTAGQSINKKTLIENKEIFHQ
jgi:hypothetical protein